MLSGCLATSAVAIIGAGSGRPCGHVVRVAGDTGGGLGYGNGNGNQTCPPGEQYSYQKKCCKPTPTPPPTCHCQTPLPTPRGGSGWSRPHRPRCPRRPRLSADTGVHRQAVHTRRRSLCRHRELDPDRGRPVVASGSPVPSGPANTGGGWLAAVTSRWRRAAARSRWSRRGSGWSHSGAGGRPATRTTPAPHSSAARHTQVYLPRHRRTPLGRWALPTALAAALLCAVGLTVAAVALTSHGPLPDSAASLIPASVKTSVPRLTATGGSGR